MVFLDEERAFLIRDTGTAEKELEKYWESQICQMHLEKVVNREKTNWFRLYRFLQDRWLDFIDND